MKKILITFVFVIFILVPNIEAKIRVYASHESLFDSITQEELINIYLKKTKRLHDNKVIILDNVNSYNEFYLQVLNKTAGQIHGYWMKEIFLGQNIPAEKISQEDVIKYLKENPSTIIYSTEVIDAKVIYEH